MSEKISVPVFSKIREETKKIAYNLAWGGFNEGLGDIDSEKAYLRMSEHKNQGKLGGISNFMSLNTNPFLLNVCKSCLINDHCYAKRLLATSRRNANRRYAYNTAILMSKEFDESMLPLIPKTIKDIRINSMGEIDNRTMLDNLMLVFNAFNDKKFTVYTRSYELMESIDKKPKNLNIVASGLYINDISLNIPKNCDKKFMMVDDSINIDETHFPVSIHLCTGKCNTCMNCYSDDGCKYIIAPVK